LKRQCKDIEEICKKRRRFLPQAEKSGITPVTAGATLAGAQKRG
jgi:hypothetical protein